MIDRGSGTPIVLIPGLQGRWEWMRPTVNALSKHNRVITFSLCDERTSTFPCDPNRGFDNFISQIEIALERADVERAVIAGVSFGGLIATEFAARHPDRVSGLVLASALHASWQPNERQQRFLNAPRLMSPFFLATAPHRMRPEMVTTFPAVGERLRFAIANAARIVMAPTSPARMARRVAWARSFHFSDPTQLKAPVLLVTGEPGLDSVVPVEVTRRYLNEFQEAEHVVLKRTGHIGLVTCPDAFAGVLDRFVNGVRLPA
jgi:pimeloyl-ACP methyl ester carboxylesterase